ncbi:ATPase family AAA domain-containing protein At1g05910-like [Populus alba]|uniref:ATPase family AAA domain-containing protein At1g05910-like n=1 Tax=Populus alba TaxID=43335 RepID=UPI003CC6F138
MLYDKRFSAFHYPVTDEDAPNYRSIIQNPMDMATMLQRVDSGQYITCSGFLQDIDLIVTNAKVYNGDDYNGARIVSRGYELRDAVHGMLSQMHPALVTYCDKIAAQGGPVQIPDDLGGSIFPSIPVVQLGTVTRTSARLRNVQPDVNLDQSYKALKRQKKNADATHAASTAEDKSRHQDSVQAKPPEEARGIQTDPSPLQPMTVDMKLQEEKLLVIPKGVDPKMLQCQTPKYQATWITSSGFSRSALKIMAFHCLKGSTLV